MKALDKILNVIGKGEYKINKVLIFIIDIIDKYILRKYLPPSIYQIKDRIQNKIEQKKQHFQKRVVGFAQLSLSYVKTKVIEPLQKIDYKKIINEQKEKVKTKLKFYISKEFWLEVLQKIKNFIVWLKAKIKNFNFIPIVASLAGLWLLYNAGIILREVLMNYYEKVTKNKTYVVSREVIGPAWPEYHKMEKRIYPFFTIEIPVYEEDGVTRLAYIGMSVKTSNNFIVNYFTKFRDQTRDYLYSNVHLIDSTFLLSNDGKIVIKNKIINELNDYLKKYKIRGQVEDVYIREILIR